MHITTRIRLFIHLFENNEKIAKEETRGFRLFIDMYDKKKK